MGTDRKFFLDEVLDKARNEVPLTKEEIIYILQLSERKEIEKVFKTARMMRERYFGSGIFLYGFVYFSTYCKNNCNFCLFRKSNNVFSRYRKDKSEILETACRLAESGVHLIDLTMGEDPVYLNSVEGLEKLVDLAELVKKSTGLPLMISPGIVSDETLVRLKDAGVNWYACYQETHNRTLFDKLRISQSYDERWERKISARNIGLLIEEGLLTGIGETADDLAESLKIMESINADQVRVMSFVPQEGTPMEEWKSPVRLGELLIIAAMRLARADRLIPASLDVDGIIGLQERLDAGANVVTSIIPPQSGLAGVSRSSLGIDDGNRTVGRVSDILESCGLHTAAREDYFRWIEERAKKNDVSRLKEAAV